MIRAVSFIALFVVAAGPAPSVIVAARSIARGALIAPADVATAPARGTVLGALTDSDQAVGMVALRALAPGVTLRADALGPATIVRRGDPVTLRAAGRGFTVEAQGSATQDGSEGAGVAVVNNSTGARLRGAAVGEGIVAVGTLRSTNIDRNPEK